MGVRGEVIVGVLKKTHNLQDISLYRHAIQQWFRSRELTSRAKSNGMKLTRVATRLSFDGEENQLCDRSAGAEARLNYIIFLMDRCPENKNAWNKAEVNEEEGVLLAEVEAFFGIKNLFSVV